MPQEDGNDGDPDDAAVDPLVRTLKQLQIADQQRNLEEADAELVEGSSGKVDTCVRDQICCRAQGNGETKAVLCLYGLLSDKPRLDF